MFGSNCSSLESLIRYKECETYYLTNAPIRGKDKDTHGVPLHYKRRQWKSYALLRRPDTVVSPRPGADNATPDGPHEYRCFLYNTPVVIYHSDNSITVDVSYGSQLTCAFANRMTPSGIYAGMRHSLAVLYVGHNTFRPLGPVRLVKSPDGWKVADTPKNRESLPQWVRPLLNRKRAAEVRSKVKDFVEYARTMQALGPIDHDTFIAMMGGTEGNYAARYASIDFYKSSAQEHWPHVLARMYFCQSLYINGGRTTRYVLADSFIAAFYAEMYRAEECYDIVPIEHGTIHPDMYSVPFGTTNIHI